MRLTANITQSKTTSSVYHKYLIDSKEIVIRFADHKAGNNGFFVDIDLPFEAIDNKRLIAKELRKVLSNYKIVVKKVKQIGYFLSTKIEGKIDLLYIYNK
jgi:hypothetical protein